MPERLVSGGAVGRAATAPGTRPHDVPALPDGTALRGELRLRIEQRDGRSYAARQYHDGALRVLRPLYRDGSGQVCYPVINPGGAYFGADRCLIDFEVGESASLLMAEIITPGWSPEGRPFRFDELRLRTEIRAEDAGRSRRVVVDQLRMVPGDGPDLTGMGLLEGRTHTGQLLIADRRLDDDLFEELAQIVEASGTRSGITRGGIEHPDGLRCVSVRSLAHSTGALWALQRQIADLLRSRWRGQGPLELRKH